MHVISFVNMKGGVGKTTLAVNVADALNRRRDKRVVFVDIDPQFNATQCLYTGEEYLDFRRDGGQTIADIFTDTSTPSILSRLRAQVGRDVAGFSTLPPDCCAIVLLRSAAQSMLTMR